MVLEGSSTTEEGAVSLGYQDWWYFVSLSACLVMLLAPCTSIVNRLAMTINVLKEMIRRIGNLFRNFRLAMRESTEESLSKITRTTQIEAFDIMVTTSETMQENAIDITRTIRIENYIQEPFADITPTTYIEVLNVEMAVVEYLEESFTDILPSTKIDVVDVVAI